MLYTALFLTLAIVSAIGTVTILAALGISAHRKARR